jgi:hypothetical protein
MQFIWSVSEERDQLRPEIYPAWQGIRESFANSIQLRTLHIRLMLVPNKLIASPLYQLCYPFSQLSVLGHCKQQKTYRAAYMVPLAFENSVLALD